MAEIVSETRPWLIVGTVPRADFPLAWGDCALDGRELTVDGRTVTVARGTPALIAAALAAAATLGAPAPRALLVGDTGDGAGSRTLYAALARRLTEAPEAFDIPGLTFHYLLPDADWHSRILLGLNALPRRPLLVADAGFMYAAKMSGCAAEWDLFTPDVGELAFLADEDAPHPFYTRGFLLADEAEAPGLIARAYQAGNAARCLLVKGRTDRVVVQGRVTAEIDGPDTPAMEPIGGTGDTLTGILTALLASGRAPEAACRAAALANRHMGRLANPDPSFAVADLLPWLPEALALALAEA